MPNLDNCPILKSIVVSFIRMICALSIAPRHGSILTSYWIWDGKVSKLATLTLQVHAWLATKMVSSLLCSIVPIDRLDLMTLLCCGNGTVLKGTRWARNIRNELWVGSF